MRENAVKRVYFKRGKSVIRQRAIDQLRDLRAQITAQNPGLLESIRDKMPSGAASKAEVAPATAMTIDRTKNLHTIMKFMELKQGSPAFNSKLKHILSEDKR